MLNFRELETWIVTTMKASSLLGSFPPSVFSEHVFTLTNVLEMTNYGQWSQY